MPLGNGDIWLNVAAPLSQLQVHRDKEEATWDFIGAELDLGDHEA
jgi:hypothetical protein